METKRYYNIEALRFLFALMIIYYHILHANIMNYVNENSVYTTLQTLSDNAGFIVECFFIISGYFLCETFFKKTEQSTLDFVLKKIFRLGPVLWFSILVGILGFSQKIQPAVFNSLFLQCIGLSLEYKGINWYISPLFWASIFYFALLKSCENKKANLAIGVLVYFSYLVNISYLNGGFGRETVFGVVNLGLARALAGIGLGYLIGVCLRSFKERTSVCGGGGHLAKKCLLGQHSILGFLQ